MPTSPRRGHPGIAPGERLRHVTVRLSEEMIALALSLGEGNISEGVRRALKQKTRQEAG